MKVGKMIYYKPNKDGSIPCNIAKPKSARYYEDVLGNISAIGGDYDGYNTQNAKQMKELVDELVDMARKALMGKPQYVCPEQDLIKGKGPSRIK